MNEYLALTLGLACAGLAAASFSSGRRRTRRLARIPAGIVGRPLPPSRHPARSSRVGHVCPRRRKPQIALGDALGSNVVNTALILGLPTTSGLQSQRSNLWRDFPLATMPAATADAAARWRAVATGRRAMLALFWPGWALRCWKRYGIATALRRRPSASERGQRSCTVRQDWSCWLLADTSWCSAPGLCRDVRHQRLRHRCDPVAIGTSMPELATTIVAAPTRSRRRWPRRRPGQQHRQRPVHRRDSRP